MQSRLTYETLTISTHPLVVGQLVYDDMIRPRMMVMLIGPHPLMGGSMDNSLMRQLGEALACTGHLVFRFDYSPLDESELAANMAQFWHTGAAPCDPSLVDQARLARDWLLGQFDLPLVMAGYSFGAHVGMSLFEPPAQGLVMIAPIVKHQHIVQAANFDKPKLVIYSNNDFATPQAATAAWFMELCEPKEQCLIAEADHFFKQHHEQIHTAVQAFMDRLPAHQKELQA